MLQRTLTFHTFQKVEIRGEHDTYFFLDSCCFDNFFCIKTFDLKLKKNQFIFHFLNCCIFVFNLKLLQFVVKRFCIPLPWQKHVTILLINSKQQGTACRYINKTHFQAFLGHNIAKISGYEYVNPGHSMYFVQTIDFLG